MSLQSEARIDLAAIRANVRELRGRTNAEVMAVVKADGYGHGIVPAARAALAGGATWLGVATLDEALTVRAAGISAPLLAWLIAPDQPLRAAVEADVELSVATGWLLEDVVAAAEASGRTARIQLKIDTGLGRGGVGPAEWPALVDAAAKHAAAGTVEITGIWSHFARADEPGDPSIAAQQKTFAEALEVAAGLGVDPPLRHLANSAAALSLPNAHFDLVRAGIAIYGYSPVPGEFGLPAGDDHARLGSRGEKAAGRPWHFVRAYLHHPKPKPRSPWCRSAMATEFRATPAISPHCGWPGGGIGSPAGCAWTSSWSMWATIRSRLGRTRFCSDRATTASPPRTTGRPLWTPSATKS